MSYTIANSTHKARIIHVCVGCLDTIKPGDIYHKWVGLIDGSDFCVSKLCEECREFFDNNSDSFHDGQFGEGEIGEMIRERDSELQMQHKGFIGD